VFLWFKKDVDDFFEHERHYLVEYHTHIKDAVAKADRVCSLRKSKRVPTIACRAALKLHLFRCGRLVREDSAESGEGGTAGGGWG
jgi:hypothetical protein